MRCSAVWKDASKFRGASAVSSWIFGIAYRQAMSALRSEKRFQRPLDRNADVGELGAPPARCLIDLLGAGLAELSPDHRQVIGAHVFLRLLVPGDRLNRLLSGRHRQDPHVPCAAAAEPLAAAAVG